MTPWNMSTDEYLAERDAQNDAIEAEMIEALRLLDDEIAADLLEDSRWGLD